MRRLLAALLCGMLVAGPAAALASETSPTLAEIEDEVMCTVCGVPLSLAREAPAAKRERVLITQLIAAGKTKQQILDDLVVEYGDQVLARPKSSGFDLWAWLVPILALTAGGGLVIWSVRLWRRRGTGGPSEPEPAQPPSGADAERVDAALREQD